MASQPAPVCLQQSQLAGAEIKGKARGYWNASQLTVQLAFLPAFEEEI